MLSERRALAVVRMSASALRYEPRPDRNVELRERIVALAQRHKRYGVGMIYLKLRQEQWPVNYKRVEGVLRQDDGDVGARARCAAALDPARQTEPERLHRELQWPPVR